MIRARGIALVAVTLFGCPPAVDSDSGDPPTPEPSRVEEVLALTGDAAAGANRYTNNCSACHPADGSTGVGPALSVAVPALTDEELVTLMLDGQGSMPSFDYLDDPVLADILAFTRSEWD